MGTGEFNFWSSGVWLIPLILLATIAGLYLLIRYWQRKTQQELKETRGALRGLHARRQEIDLVLQAYSQEPREPYASRLGELQARLEEIDSQLAGLERQNVAIQEGMRQLASNRWQATVGAPFFWFSLRRESAGLRKALEAQHKALDEAAKSSQELERLGWEIASQARQAQETHQQARRLIEKFQGQNLQGQSLQAAAHKESDLRQALAQIPAYFFNEEETAVLSQAQQAHVAEAHAVLSQAQPELDTLLAQLQGWEQAHAETTAKVAALRQVLDRVDRSLDNIPDGLDLTATIDQFDKLKIISRNLQDTLSRLEIESMGAVAEESGRVHAAVQEIDNQVKQSRQQLGDLKRVLDELSEGLQMLSAQFAALGTAGIHPLAWGQSRIVLTRLSREASAIGTIKKSRNPEQISQDLASAARLNVQQKELSDHCQEIARQHGELLDILASPEFARGQEWLQGAQILKERAGSYDPDNWPRIDSVASFAQDLGALADGLKRLAGNPAEPVGETDLAQRLQDTRQLAQFYQSLRNRADHIQTRLEEIQSSEQQAQDQASGIRSALNQLTLLARSNAFLGETATAEINRLQSSYEQAARELEQRERGPVERKARSVVTLLARIEQSANNWLERLNKEIELQKNALAADLSDLEEITELDEPAVAEAHRLLGSGQAYGASGFPGKTQFGMNEAILELRRRSDYWQSCNAALRSLEDVAQPLFETFSAASQNRQHLREQIAEISNWMRGARSWPPTSVSLDSERQELAKVEAEWEAVKSRPAKAITLVAQIGSISAKYQALSSKVQQIAERAAQEQSQVEKLEADIDELAQLWQQQMQTYRDNPNTTEEIRRLLGELENQHSSIKRQYRQGGKTYEQILQALQSLQRRIRIAQVSIDENHVIDVNGRMIAYR